MFLSKVKKIKFIKVTLKKDVGRLRWMNLKKPLMSLDRLLGLNIPSAKLKFCGLREIVSEEIGKLGILVKGLCFM